MEQQASTVGTDAASLFLLSFRHRDELAAAAARAGWRAIAARRADGAEQRFIASGAGVAVVDARGAFPEGLEAVRALADPAEANAAALLALVSRTDIGRLGELFAGGATHYLASPFGEAELAQALRFAERHAERLGGGARLSRPALHQSEVLSWRCTHDHVALSPALGERLGLTNPAWRTLYRTLKQEDRAAARSAWRRVREGARTTAFSHRLPDGMRVAHHLAMEEGVLTGLVEPLADGAAAPARSRDFLTGLADAAGARRWLGSREGRTAVLLVALSRFDMVNNAYGRAAGDALLQAAARRIERVVTELAGRGAFLARMAGAEFLVALPDADLARARFVAERVVEAVERRFGGGVETVTLGVRVGGLEAEPGAGPVALLRRASAALAEAKISDAAVRLLSRGEQDASAQAESLAGDLRQALSAGEIEILFQPQVAVASGAIVGVEALARWRHPALGVLGAESLFGAAERSDYLAQLSEHVQARALEEAARWPAALGHLRLSINVTAVDLARPRFVETMLERADAAGFPRAQLTVEVTESGLIEDLGSAAGLLAQLRAAGLRVAIDDFGTGYSSLAYLKALPLDYLKIDKRLSQDIAGSARDRVVVRGVIEMARSLGLGVIAEGVETEAQLALLAAEGCTLYQGFLCSEPVGVEGLVRLLDPPRNGEGDRAR